MASTRRSKDEVKKAAADWADRARRGEHGLPRDDTHAVLPLTVPSIHLNGSSPDVLLEDYRTAAMAVASAIDALGRVMPHGRDYYVQGEGALAHAIKEHRARIKKLENVRDELTAIARHVRNEQARRGRR